MLCLYLGKKTRQIIFNLIQAGFFYVANDIQLNFKMHIFRTTTVRADKTTANNKCLESFRKAVDCDSNDHLGLYYLALQSALMGKLAEAVVCFLILLL